MKKFLPFCCGILFFSVLSIVASLTGGLRLSGEGFLLMAFVAVVSFFIVLSGVIEHISDKPKAKK